MYVCMCVCVSLSLYMVFVSLHADHLSARHEWETGLSQGFIDYYDGWVIILEEAASIPITPTPSVQWIARVGSTFIHDDDAFGWPGRLGA